MRLRNSLHLSVSNFDILSAVWSYSKRMWERYPLNKTAEKILWLVKRLNAHNHFALFCFVLSNMLYRGMYQQPLTLPVLINSDSHVLLFEMSRILFFLILEKRNILRPWITWYSIEATQWDLRKIYHSKSFSGLKLSLDCVQI